MSNYSLSATFIFNAPDDATALAVNEAYIAKKEELDRWWQGVCESAGATPEGFEFWELVQEPDPEDPTEDARELFSI